MTFWTAAITLCFISPVVVLLWYLWNVKMYRLYEERCNRLQEDKERLLEQNDLLRAVASIEGACVKFPNGANPND